MVFSLDSSLVLAAIVGLWLVWVAPFVLRTTIPATIGSTVRSPKARTRRPEGSMMTMTATEGTAAGSGSTPEPRAHQPSAARTEDVTSTPGASGRIPSFRPRWGRIAVALVGVLALVAALVTFVLTAFGVVPGVVPLACIGLTAGAVAVLRLLAVRARRARIDNAFAAAMAPVRPESSEQAPEPALPAVPQRPTALFDAEEPVARPLTAMELRAAALAVARGATAETTGSELQTENGTVARPAGATAWAPVEVPRPIYVDAAKAERHAPAPLDLPEAPKPSSKTPIKASEAAARVASASSDSADTLAGSTPVAGRINLDDVLQRRRA